MSDVTTLRLIVGDDKRPPDEDNLGMIVRTTEDVGRKISSGSQVTERLTTEANTLETDN